MKIILAALFQRRHHLIKVELRMKRLGLFHQSCRQFRTRYRHQSRDVIDRLFWIKFGTLPTGPIENVNPWHLMSSSPNSNTENKPHGPAPMITASVVITSDIARPQNCLAGTFTRKPSSASETLIWQESLELSRTSKAKSNMSSSMGLRAPTFSRHSGST